MSLKKRFEVLNIANKVFSWIRPGHSGRFLSGPDFSGPRHLDPTGIYKFLVRFQVASCRVRIGSGL